MLNFWRILGDSQFTVHTQRDQFSRLSIQGGGGIYNSQCVRILTRFHSCQSWGRGFTIDIWGCMLSVNPPLPRIMCAIRFVQPYYLRAKHGVATSVYEECFGHKHAHAVNAKFFNIYIFARLGTNNVYILTIFWPYNYKQFVTVYDKNKFNSKFYLNISQPRNLKSVSFLFVQIKICLLQLHITSDHWNFDRWWFIVLLIRSALMWGHKFM